MNRTIRFRVWDKDMKRMRSVHELHSNGMVLVKDGNEISVGLTPSEFILMQSTGLFDRTGREIYEGDIIDMHPPKGYEDTKINVVEFERGAFVLKIKTGASSPFWMIDHLPHAEIIGDICSNPELIKP